jgi:hypothetical protein
MDPLFEIVDRFAEALDRDDYVTASHCMEPDATYDDADKIIVGRDAILASFKATSDWGRTHLDELRFLHHINQSAPLEIHFIDILICDREELTLEHAMHVTLSKRGLIAQLRLIRPLDERAKVRAFFERHGIQRP